jgi:hypothetical protein
MAKAAVRNKYRAVFFLIKVLVAILSVEWDWFLEMI